jgi:ABC-type nitrate/sulfonate/bicarbonate transport system substrate-binding protein
MHSARLVFEKWAVDDDVLLPTGKDFAAGQIDGFCSWLPV